MYRKKLIDKIKSWCSEELNSEVELHGLAEHDELILKGRAEMSDCIIKLINDYIKNVAKDNKEDYDKFRKKLIKMSKNGG